MLLLLIPCVAVLDPVTVPSLPSHILFKFQVPAAPRPGQPRQVVAFPSAAEKRRGKSEPGWGWRGKNVDLDSKVL